MGGSQRGEGSPNIECLNERQEIITERNQKAVCLQQCKSTLRSSQSCTLTDSNDLEPGQVCSS